MNSVVDIHSKGEYPSCAISNFAEYEFYIDGIKCMSMEGFLQSLKFKSVSKQKKICLLSSAEAKNSTRYKFAQLRWRITHNLYWQGRKICRFSDGYQKLLDRAYKELSGNKDFMNALKSTGNSSLVHSVGKTDTRKTVLTEYELVSRLMHIRDEL